MKQLLIILQTLLYKLCHTRAQRHFFTREIHNFSYVFSHFFMFLHDSICLYICLHAFPSVYPLVCLSVTPLHKRSFSSFLSRHCQLPTLILLSGVVICAKFRIPSTQSSCSSFVYYSNSRLETQIPTQGPNPSP